MPHEGILQSDPQVVCGHEACLNVYVQGLGDVKVGRVPSLNLVRDENSRLWINALVERQKRYQEFNNRIVLITKVRDGSTFVSAISSVKSVDEYT